MKTITIESLTQMVEDVDKLTSGTRLSEAQCKSILAQIDELKNRIKTYPNHQELLTPCLLSEFYLETRITEIIESKYKAG